jgi:hypothetical protein
MPGTQSSNSSKRDIQQEDLGALIQHFPTRSQKLKRWLPLLVGSAAILTALGLTLFLVSEIRTRIAIHGRAILLGIFPNPIGLYVFLLLAGIFSTIFAVTHWHDGITVFEQGVVKQTAKKVKHWNFARTERFDNSITQIMFGGSVVSTRIKITFADGAGKRFSIPNRYEQMMDLIEVVRERLLPDLIERAQQRLQNGDTLNFHKHLSADLSGLSINGQVLPYDQVEPVIHNQVIAFHHKENPHKVLFKSQINRIQNLDVLLSLLEHPPAPLQVSQPK